MLFKIIFTYTNGPEVYLNLKDPDLEDKLNKIIMKNFKIQTLNLNLNDQKITVTANSTDFNFEETETWNAGHFSESYGEFYNMMHHLDHFPYTIACIPWEFNEECVRCPFAGSDFKFELFSIESLDESLDESPTEPLAE